MRRYYIMVAAMILLQQAIAAKHNHDTTMTTSKGLIAPKLSEHKPTEREIRNFWKKVNKEGPIPDQSKEHYLGLNQCWEWTGATDSNGYGTFWFGNKVRAVHRVAFLLQNGYLAEGLEVMHLCDNRKCVRHLQLGSTGDNVRDSVRKGRHVAPRGEKQGLSKLTSQQVLLIREKHSTERTRQIDLAVEFGVRQSVISSIIRRETWKHI